MTDTMVTNCVTGGVDLGSGTARSPSTIIWAAGVTALRPPRNGSAPGADRAGRVEGRARSVGAGPS